MAVDFRAPVFPTPSELLKNPDGLLLERPLPLLLHAVLVTGRTCGLTVKRRQLEKRILFEEGVPVGCTTNLLHETLGRYLVERGKLAEPDYQACLAESAAEGLEMGELLVRKGLFSAFELYKQLQGNLAHTILDCFRWVDAQYVLEPDPPAAKSPVRMNALQLILTGIGQMPFDAVATQMSFVDEQRFALVQSPPHALGELKLPPKELRVLQLLRARPTFNELAEKTQLPTEPLLRRLYSLAVLGFVDFAEAVPEAQRAPSRPEPAAEPEPVAPAAAPPASPYGDEDEARRNELTQLFMGLRTKDPFELLGVPEDVAILAVRQAFLALADRFSPVRFRTQELREKAETVLLSLARAFAELSNPEQLALWRKRRAADRAPKAAQRPAGVPMSIQTDLLDARAQVEQGLKRLAAQDYKGALALFEYACEIEERGLYVAHRAWARFLLNPAQHRRLAQQELERALGLEPGCDVAFYYLGELHRAAQELPAAEAAFRRAFKLNPNERRYAELIRVTLEAQKR